MSILVCLHHFLNNLLYVLVCSLNNAIHLWTVWQGIKMFNFEVFAQLLHHLVIEVQTIISNDFVRNPIMVDDISFQTAGNHLFCYISKRCSFHPFGEVVYAYQNKPMSIRISWFNTSDHINAPHCKG